MKKKDSIPDKFMYYFTRGIEIYIWCDIIYLAFYKFPFTFTDLRHLIGLVMFYTIYVIVKSVNRKIDTIVLEVNLPPPNKENIND